jgi:hypothetical protein
MRGFADLGGEQWQQMPGRDTRHSREFSRGHLPLVLRPE